ncbi:hypothetical protein BGZ60DRAFT_154914 [Tricladium varicosporioides]|nr:hypothetical protein BGZ60DRAFT_154914 [Hymenoscyphus varicosporioides]
MVYDFNPGTARNPVIIAICFTFLAALTTALRVRSKWMRKSRLTLDDYLVIIAVFLIFANQALQIASVVVGGLGRHVDDVPSEPVIPLLQMIFVLRLLYGIEVTLVKLAVLTLYYRLFGSRGCFRVTAWIVAPVLILWGICIILEVFLDCKPLAFNWDLRAHGTCVDRRIMHYSVGSVNIGTDVLLLILPIPYIIGLRLESKRKFGILAMFSLGIFNTVVSVLRMRALINADGSDITYTLATVYMWTLLDPCVLTINANLPMVRNFCMLVAPRIFGSPLDHSIDNRMQAANEDPRFMIDTEDRYGSNLSGRYGDKPFGTQVEISGGRKDEET